MSKEKSFTDIAFRGKNYSNLLKATAKSIAINEVSDSYEKAFKLSKAPTSKSGYSYGGNQLDLGIRANKSGEKVINKHAAKLFLNIMNNATDAQGNHVISGDHFLNNIARFDNKLNLVGGAITEIGNNRKLSPEQLETINKALSSDYGKKLISEDFIEEISKRIEKVSNLIDTKITSIQMKETLKQEEILILLVDYDNQFNIASKGKMIQFLIDSQSNDDFASKNVKNWVLENTKYGKEHPDDLRRRHINIEKSLALYNIDEKIIFAAKCEFIVEDLLKHQTSILIDDVADFDKESITQTIKDAVNEGVVIGKFGNEHQGKKCEFILGYNKDNSKTNNNLTPEQYLEARKVATRMINKFNEIANEMPSQKYLLPQMNKAKSKSSTMEPAL